MNADWNNTSSELPRDGQQIEFVLDHRSVAMTGAYLHQSVRTRWAEYAIERVRSWRIRAPGFDQYTDLNPPPSHHSQHFVATRGIAHAA